MMVTLVYWVRSRQYLIGGIGRGGTSRGGIGRGGIGSKNG